MPRAFLASGDDRNFAAPFRRLTRGSDELLLIAGHRGDRSARESLRPCCKKPCYDNARGSGPGVGAGGSEER